MDDVGTLVAKLALRSKLISQAQFETVSQAYAESGGRKPYGAILLESGIITGGALTRLLHEHQRKISERIEEIFTRRIIEKGYATDGSIREVRATLEDIRLHGFDFDMLELLVKRSAITHPQASELRQYLRTKVLICPICLRTEPRNGHENAVSCPDCHEEFSAGASDKLMSRFVTVAAMFNADGAAPAAGPVSSISSPTLPEIPPQLGAYRVNREVGRGGMAVVYEAEDLRTGTRVAIKVLKAGSALDKSNLSRFYSEIEALQKLSHPNIVKVLGVGESGGHHFYAMQFIDGRGLDRMVNECKQDLRKTVAWVRDIAHALDSAHDQGIVHRDVKPGNILVDLAGRVYLTDFGLALRDRAVRVTLSGTTLGTPNFMSPEQARGERNKLDRRTDVYSLGATLYNLCTGRVPYWENTPELVVQKILHEDPKPPMELNPTIDRPLQIIILKAMDKEPGNRYPSCAAMAEDLDRWLGGSPIHATPPISQRILVKWWRRHRRTVTIASISAAAASTVALILILRQLAVTESLAVEKTAVEEERDGYRKDRKEPAMRFAEDRGEALTRTRDMLNRDVVEFEKKKDDMVRQAAEKNIKDKNPDHKARALIMAGDVQARRTFAGELFDFGNLLMKREDYSSALLYLRKAEEVYRYLFQFLPGIKESNVRDELRKADGFVENINVGRHLEELAERIPKAESLEIWMQWLADKDAKTALESIGRVVTMHPGRLEPVLRRGYLLLRTGKPDQADDDFEAVLARDPRNVAARLGMVEYWLQRREQYAAGKAAIELGRLAEGSRQGPEYVLVEGMRLMKAGDNTAAAAWLEFKKEAAIEFMRDPANATPDLISARAACLVNLGQNEEANKMALKAEYILRDLEDKIYRDYRKLTGRPELPYEIWATAAKSWYALRRIADSKAAAKRALEYRPEDPAMTELLRIAAR
ncbi:MAG TPA: protein kinase [Planctomycetota bacterium]|nr:protein kinase [Planctomycetota bacterium]